MIISLSSTAQNLPACAPSQANPILPKSESRICRTGVWWRAKASNSIFSAFANTEETYSTYSVYILREDDNLEEVIAKYNTNREVLSEYNDLDNLKVGSKLIIPTSVESND